MNAIPFDTHRVVKRLKEAGFSEPQAETVTDVLREARDTELSSLATKSELKAEIAALRDEMRADNKLLRADVESAIARGQADTLKWMIGLLLVQGGLIVGVLRLLPGH